MEMTGRAGGQTGEGGGDVGPHYPPSPLSGLFKAADSLFFSSMV